jgi:hypothetical protein
VICCLTPLFSNLFVTSLAKQVKYVFIMWIIKKKPALHDVLPEVRLFMYSYRLFPLLYQNGMTTCRYCIRNVVAFRNYYNARDFSPPPPPPPPHNTHPPNTYLQCSRGGFLFIYSLV